MVAETIGNVIIGVDKVLEEVKPEAMLVLGDTNSCMVVLSVKHRKIPNFYFSANALLVTLKESPVFTITIPGKLQSYMSAGKLILTMLSGEGSRMSRDELALLGKKAKHYSDTEFNRSMLITQLEDWFYGLSNTSKKLKK